MIYIPLWSYSNSCSNLFNYRIFKIYIPLWSYSNNEGGVNMIKGNPFTFHYGPIQIMIMQNLYLNFTNLHSTMVLFKLVLNSSKIYNVIHLHSTMVLFKLILCPVGRYSALIFTFHYGPIQIGQSFFFARIYFTKFTFHYGPIQIEFCNTYKYLELRFTFHYGPIQIRRKKLHLTCVLIYIPLWSYSNCFFHFEA